MPAKNGRPQGKRPKKQALEAKESRYRQAHSSQGGFQQHHENRND